MMLLLSKLIPFSHKFHKDSKSTAHSKSNSKIKSDSDSHSHPKVKSDLSSSHHFKPRPKRTCSDSSRLSTSATGKKKHTKTIDTAIEDGSSPSVINGGGKRRSYRFSNPEVMTRSQAKKSSISSLQALSGAGFTRRSNSLSSIPRVSNNYNNSHLTSSLPSSSQALKRSSSTSTSLPSTSLTKNQLHVKNKSPIIAFTDDDATLLDNSINCITNDFNALVSSISPNHFYSNIPSILPIDEEDDVAEDKHDKIQELDNEDETEPDLKALQYNADSFGPNIYSNSNNSGFLSANNNNGFIDISLKSVNTNTTYGLNEIDEWSFNNMMINDDNLKNNDENVSSNKSRKVVRFSK